MLRFFFFCEYAFSHKTPHIFVAYFPILLLLYSQVPANKCNSGELRRSLFKLSIFFSFIVYANRSKPSRKSRLGFFAFFTVHNFFLREEEEEMENAPRALACSSSFEKKFFPLACYHTKHKSL